MGIQAAHVSGLFVCAVAGAPMKAVDQVKVMAGVGLEGDRYAAGVGTYSVQVPLKVRHVTFISQDGIDTANEWQEASGLPAFAPGQTRRNVLIAGMSPDALNNLVGRTFSIAGMLFKGLELATPCHQPSEVTGQEGFVDAFDNRGGLRAEACTDGVIRIGDLLIS